ncbi:hypothetical protein, partial [Actinomadura keratinilytica]|uniref:hypothetical protein n=1 Tax=Actinomadura keratinilytica TaxID=547461 RepID=UPI003CD07A59
EQAAAGRRPLPDPGRPVRLAVRVGAGAECRFTAAAGTGPRPLGDPFTATGALWVGATLGLFAAAPPGPGPAAGHADFGGFHVDGEQEHP